MRTGAEGFTLVEALATLMIVGLFLALLFPRYGENRDRLEEAAFRRAFPTLVRTGVSLAASRETPVVLAYDPVAKRLYLAAGDPPQDLGRGFDLRLPRRLNLTSPVPAGNPTYLLRFDRRGILVNPPPPVQIAFGGLTFRVSRWGEVY